MAQGDIIRKMGTREVVASSPVQPTGKVGQALVAALAKVSA